MDTLILFLLAVTLFFTIRDKHRVRILAGWAASLVLALLLFNYHVTSPLDLQF